jgi:hypothetical protein
MKANAIVSQEWIRSSWAWRTRPERSVPGVYLFPRSRRQPLTHQRSFGGWAAVSAGAGSMPRLFASAD